MKLPRLRYAVVFHTAVGMTVLLACHMLLTSKTRGRIHAARQEVADVIKQNRQISAQLEKLEEESATLHVRVDDVNKRIRDWSNQHKQRAKRRTHLSRQLHVEKNQVHEAELQGFQRNRVVMDGPYCTPVPKPSKGLPKFVFVAGVEGSGHHALLSVWEQLKAVTPLELVVYDQVFHQLGVENHASYHYSRISQQEREEAMRPIFEHATKRNAIVIDAQNSYPMGQYAGSLAHPDLLQLQKMDGQLFDLRVIVLYRNPTDAVLSAVRRFRTDDGPAKYKNHQFQARMVAESLVAINNALPQLPCEKWVMVQFEDFVHNPRLLAGPFARLLGLPKSAFDVSFSKVRAPSRHREDETTLTHRPMLDDYFGRQSVLWPLLASAAKRIS